MVFLPPPTPCNEGMPLIDSRGEYAVPRLSIRGRDIYYPDGKPALLRGMNVMFELDSEFAFPRADTDDLLFELLPGTNLLRLVMLRWDDRPTRAKNGDGNDCSSGNIHSGRAIAPRCLEQFTEILRWCDAQCPMPKCRHDLSPDVIANQVRVKGDLGGRHGTGEPGSGRSARRLPGKRKPV